MAEGVVFLPGIMGSELYLGDELIWPGTPAEMLFPYGKDVALICGSATLSGGCPYRVSTQA